MNYWWCNQSECWEEESRKGVVCSSDHSGNLTYRKTVNDVKTGDLIVHYRSPEVWAISCASENAKYSSRLPLNYISGWIFKTKYRVLKNGIHREEFTSELSKIRKEKYPVNSVGNIHQGYFFPFDELGFQFIISLIQEKLPTWLMGNKKLPIDIKKILLDIDDESTPQRKEGKQILYFGTKYERNPRNRLAAINYHGISCSVCGFNFEEFYGKRGKDFIEVHHLKPLSDNKKEIEIDPINDMRPLCSNCHRMIHRNSKEILTIEQLKTIIKK